MQHPVAVHIRTIELLMLELTSDLQHERDSVRRMHLSDRIDSLGWILKCYRLGLEVEQQRVVAKLTLETDRQIRIDDLRRLRDELRRRLLSSDSDESALRRRMLEVAEQINDLEAET